LNGRINENLNLTRALGDLQLKNNPLLPYKEQALSGFPDVVMKFLEGDEKIIFMGCDGVFEKLSDIEIRNIIFDELISNQPLQVPVCKILDRTLAPSMGYYQFGYDNMSGILIVLK